MMNIDDTYQSPLRWYRWLQGFLMMVVHQYRAKSCQKSAASLTYITLFATVPMMTVTYSMFSIIPAFQHLGSELQALIFDHVLPNSEQHLIQYLQDFSQQARGLTAVGSVFLLVTAYMMLNNIEQNFNSIWGVTQGRRGVANFLLYWAIFSLGPLLLGAALAMSTYLASFKFLVGTYSLGLVEWVLQFAPWILTWAAFTLLFVAVPNCKVPIKHALIGGLVTTVCFQLLKAIFGWIVSHSSFNLVYGAFAAVPLFMMWVNLIWTVILGGAVFVHAINAYQIDLRDRNYPDLLASVLILWQCYMASARGEAVSEQQLMQQGLSADQWLRIRDALETSNWITTNYQGDYLLSHSLKSLTLKQLTTVLHLPRQMPDEIKRIEQLPWAKELLHRLADVDASRDALLEINLEELFSQMGKS
jgi:membrane protein